MSILSTLLASNHELNSVFGQVTPPQGVEQFNQGGNIGIVLFISTIIRVATIVAGLWVMINFIIAGYDYITAQGDTGAHQRVQDRLTMSLIGLALIIGSYTLAGLVGLIFFGDASFILNPVIYGPGSGSPTPPSVPAGFPGGGPMTP